MTRLFYLVKAHLKVVRDSLNSIKGLADELKEFAINKNKPLLGICVGLQMFADIGFEEKGNQRIRLDFWKSF